MITAKVQGAVKVVDDQQVHAPIEAVLEYNELDPLVVQVAFQHRDFDKPVVWDIARELLMHGVVSLTPYGQGDVKMRYLGPGTNQVVLCLSSRNGHADVCLNQKQLVRFLNQTMDAVRFGDESVDVDEFLKELFA